jgi:2-hydroxychromene-2-carboxylate isomerase
VPARAVWAEKDLQDWARYHGIEIGQPPVFPVNSVRVMRGAFLALEQDRLVDYAREAFRTYWRDLEDIGRPAVLRGIAERAGLHPDDLEAYVERDEVKARLRANTEELVERGGFGSPTLFLDEDDMYFGNDRMPLVDAALARARNRERNQT